MIHRHLFLIISLLSSLMAWAANPMATDYSYWECAGSYMPYPVPEKTIATPDSLQAVMINHVGRHGARYPSSASNCVAMRTALLRADSLGTLTPLGQDLLGIVDRVMAECQGQWGALDSLGMAEQRGIASRMFMTYPDVFASGQVNAISSYSPRCMMSMYSFTHQLDRLNNKLEFSTLTGRVNDALLRPFDVDQDYINFRKSNSVSSVYDEYFEQTCPFGALVKVLGKNYPFANPEEARNLALAEYSVIAGLAAMSIDVDPAKFFSLAEYNALWSCANLKQYLQRTSTTLSSIPAEIASDLLLDLISTTEAYINGESKIAVRLRFGHAETLMPLLSLMRLPGCNYLTNYFDTVGKNWKNFYVVPMASNLQLILFKTERGQYYLRVDLNEQPVPLIPGSSDLYIPWKKASAYLLNCVPLYAQP
ncbi:MAG: histidine phosphatase family protein [Bacteroidales bacterium]|nr:histidine phosphatase family protein [Bacteroidales bacterium]